MFSIVFFQNIYTIDFYLFHSLHEDVMKKDRETHLRSLFNLLKKKKLKDFKNSIDNPIL